MVGKQIPIEDEYLPGAPTHPSSDPELHIKYNPDTDILYLSGVGPVIGSFGDTVARNLVVFTNEAGDENVGVMILNASKILLPHLVGAEEEAQPSYGA